MSIIQSQYAHLVALNTISVSVPSEIAYYILSN